MINLQKTKEEDRQKKITGSILPVKKSKVQLHLEDWNENQNRLSVRMEGADKDVCRFRRLFQMKNFNADYIPADTFTWIGQTVMGSPNYIIMLIFLDYSLNSQKQF